MELVNAWPAWMTAWVILLLILWTAPWKAVALWKAAGNKHLAWYVCIFIFNTLAILEIIYIFGAGSVLWIMSLILAVLWLLAKIVLPDLGLGWLLNIPLFIAGILFIIWLLRRVFKLF